MERFSLSNFIFYHSRAVWPPLENDQLSGEYRHTTLQVEPGGSCFAQVYILKIHILGNRIPVKRLDLFHHQRIDRHGMTLLVLFSWQGLVHTNRSLGRGRCEPALIPLAITVTLN